MVVTEFWLQQPLLSAPCLAVLPGPGLVTAALQAEGLLCCSSAKLQKLHILKTALKTAHSGVGGLQSPFFLAPMANRDGQFTTHKSCF